MTRNDEKRPPQKPVKPHTEERLAIFENGYTPLPNIDKMCVMKGWPREEITEEVIEKWDRIGGWTATGLRLQDGLAAIDFDIDDPRVQMIYEALLDEFPALQSAIFRRGKGHKEAWFVRTEEEFGRIATPTFVDPELDDPEGLSLEVFGGGSARQFGAMGWHTKDELEYRWVDDASPVNVPLDELPRLPKEAFYDIVDWVTAALLAMGFEQVDSEMAGETNRRHDYSLHPDMVFVTREDGELTLDELRDALDGAGRGHYYCSASFWRGGIAQNTRRCSCSLDNNGGVQVWDSRDDVIFHEAVFDPDRIAAARVETQRAVAEHLSRIGGAPPSDRAETQADQMNVYAQAEGLLRDYAYYPGGDCAIPIASVSPLDQIKMTGFRRQNERWSERLEKHAAPPNTNGGVVNPVDIWLSAQGLTVVDGASIRPDQPFPLFREDGKLIKNYFSLPEHPSSGGEIDTFIDFMNGFVPDKREREWLLDHIAYKAQHPECAQVGVVFVSEEGGCGRGTLADILQFLFHKRNCGLLDADRLLGRNSQAAFKGDFASKVILFCEELPSTGEENQTEQHRIYNKLKELVDTRAKREILAIKYGKPVEMLTCTSYFFATNNPDALPLPSSDRRFVVLQNGSRRTKEFWCRLRNWMGESANIGALYRFLMARDVSGYSPTEVFETPARQRMIAETRYHSEQVVEEILRDISSDMGGMPRVVSLEAMVAEARTRDSQLEGRRGSERIRKALEKAGYHCVPTEGHGDERGRIRPLVPHTPSGIKRHTVMSLKTANLKVTSDTDLQSVKALLELFLKYFPNSHANLSQPEKLKLIGQEVLRVIEKK